MGAPISSVTSADVSKFHNFLAIGGKVASSLLSFLPQMFIIALLALKFGTDRLPLCLMLQTLVFVAYNKVNINFNMVTSAAIVHVES